MTKNKIYAIRGGEHHGIYYHWCDAMDADFNKKMGNGNGCAFPLKDVELANEWINRKPAFEYDLVFKSPIVRFILRMILCIVGVYAMINIVYRMENMLECTTDDLRQECIGLKQVV